MKKFKFRLQKVLEHRQAVQNDKKRVLMLKNRVLADAEEKFDRLSSAAQSLPPGEDSIEANLAGLYLLRLRAEMADTSLEIEDARKEVEAALNEYVEASRDAKALEKLRERKESLYMEKVYKAEREFLDELATQKGNTLNQTGDVL